MSDFTDQDSWALLASIQQACTLMNWTAKPQALLSICLVAGWNSVTGYGIARVSKRRAGGMCKARMARNDKKMILPAYNVQLALLLQTRWRDVHGQDGKEQQEAAASAAAGRAAAGAAAAATGSDHQDDNGTVEEPGSSKGEGGGRKPRGKRPREQQQEQQERKEEEQRIAQGIGEASRGSGGAFVSGCQRSVFAAMHSYADVTMPCRTYPSSMQDPVCAAVPAHGKN
eukprot:1157358-Pelagomonas_calceolata.AAC.9